MPQISCCRSAASSSAMLHRLDDSLLLGVLARLWPPSALAKSQLVCRHWDFLITTADLWQRHAHSSGSGSSRSPPGVLDSRDVCLHWAASFKWVCGHITVSATFTGHAGPVTCMDASDHTVVTGSSDGTARVWDLQRGMQRHVLHMPGAEAVVAVALPSANLAVTATRAGAVLWRAGAAIRRFEALPGGCVTAVARTDTQLLLASSAGTVQHFDLFSGRQQSITRHSSAVTCLRTHRQQQQPPQPWRQLQQQQAGMGEEEWLVLVGCMDGQVSCVSSCTGRLLWQLPTRHPSKIVSMQLVHLPPGLYNLPLQQQPQQQAQQQQQQLQQQGAKGRRGQMPQQRQQQWLLHVLNARLQLITWQLPRGAVETGSGPQEEALAGHARQQHRQHRSGQDSSSSRSGSRQAAAGREGSSSSSSRSSSRAAAEQQAAAALPAAHGMPLWPLLVCSVATSVPQSTPRQAQNRGSEQRQQQEHGACQPPGSPEQQPQVPQQGQVQAQQQQQQQQQGMRQLLRGAHNTATCMVGPLFGLDCVLVGSSLGYLSVVQLEQQGAAEHAASSAGGGTATQGDSTGSGSTAGSGIDVAGAPPPPPPPPPAAAAAAAALHIDTGGPSHPAAGVVAASVAAAGPPAASTDAAGAAAAAECPTNGVPAQQPQHKLPVSGSAASGASTTAVVSLVRHRPLHKLARLLASRHAGTGSTAAGASSQGGVRTHAASSAAAAATGGPRAGSDSPEADAQSAALRAQEVLLAGCRVQCMQFMPDGQLLLGLGSGHVCMLKLRHPVGSSWA